MPRDDKSSPLHSDHVALVPIPTAGDIDARLVKYLPVDGPTSSQNLRAHPGWRIKQNRTLAEKRGRVHGRAIPAGIEIDGRWLREEGHDVDVVRNTRSVLGQWPRIVWVGVVGGNVVDGLGAVEEEDVFFVCRDGYFGLAGFVCVDEDGGHLEKSAVVEVAVVVRFTRLQEFRLGRAVGRADVVGFAKVVPGYDFNVVRLQLQKVHPAVDVDVGVLCVQPVGVAGKTLEEPRGYACHPGLAIGVARVGEGLVHGSFFGGGEGGMDPGEGACATVGERGDFWAGFAERTGEEGDADFYVVNDVGLPVPGWRVDFEGAEEDVARCVFGLRRAVGVPICDVDDLSYVEHGGGVDGQEELEP